uniref:Hexosyltransferase n=1 Tax=Pongo abelii TaxID=9601 RepID=H2PGF9_PONAB
MGGPGMIFSREVLRRMVPHIGECLREMYTTHEDVEVGRCVRRFGGTQCVWSYEIAGTCHRKEQEVILNVLLLVAHHISSSSKLGTLTRISGNTFKYLLFEAEAVNYSSKKMSFHELSVHTAIDGHSHSSCSAWCSPIDRDSTTVS